MYRIYSSANTTKAQHTNIHGISVTKGNLHVPTSSVPCASSLHHILLRTEQLEKGEKWSEHDAGDGIAAIWGGTEEAVLEEHKVEKTQLRFTESKVTT